MILHFVRVLHSCFFQYIYSSFFVTLPVLAAAPDNHPLFYYCEMPHVFLLRYIIFLNHTINIHEVFFCTHLYATMIIVLFVLEGSSLFNFPRSVLFIYVYSFFLLSPTCPRCSSRHYLLFPSDNLVKNFICILNHPVSYFIINPSI